MDAANDAEQCAGGQVADGDVVHGGLLSVQAVDEVADQFAAGGVFGFGFAPVGADLLGGGRGVQGEDVLDAGQRDADAA